MSPTPRHYEFAREYAKGTDAKAAAIKAGFSEKTASDRAYAWIGKNRSESMYPELFDLVQELRQAAKEETVDEISELKEFLRDTWKKGTMGLRIDEEIEMPQPVKQSDRLRAAEIYKGLLPAPAQESTVHLRVEDFGDFGNLSPEEKIQLFELMKKAKKKEES